MHESIAQNEFGQPIGPSLDGWTAPAMPPWKPLVGTYVRLEPMHRAQHAVPLFHTFKRAPEDLWTYLPYGPFLDAAELGQTIDYMAAESVEGIPDFQLYAVVVDEVVLGFLSYLRIAPRAGSIEIGAITFSPQLQRTTAASEALFLMIKNSFDLGYRRCEWKCDHLNAPSRAAAERYGFSYEGLFRKATHYKGRSRDTAWYAITDDQWPVIGAAFEAWLNPENFDADGQQKVRLEDIRSTLA